MVEIQPRRTIYLNFTIAQFGMQSAPTAGPRNSPGPVVPQSP